MALVAPRAGKNSASTIGTRLPNAPPITVTPTFLVRLTSRGPPVLGDLVTTSSSLEEVNPWKPPLLPALSFGKTIICGCPCRLKLTFPLIISVIPALLGDSPRRETLVCNCPVLGSAGVPKRP